MNWSAKQSVLLIVSPLQRATVLTPVKRWGFAMLIRLCRTARGSSPGLNRPLLTSAALGGPAIGRRRDEEQVFAAPNKEQGRGF
jgi:hypothetical protein